MPNKALLGCLAYLTDYGQDDAFPAYFKSVRSRILSDFDAAQHLVELIADAEHAPDAPCFTLLAVLLDECRMGVENDLANAEFFLEVIEECLEARHDLSKGIVHRVAGIYVSIGLPVPACLTLDVPGMGELTESADIDISELIDPLIAEVKEKRGTAYDLYQMLEANLATMPADFKVILSGAMASTPGPMIERCALFLFVEETDQAREQIIRSFLRRISTTPLRPETLKLLPALRGWLPPGPLQDGLDQILKAGRRQEASVLPHAPPPSIKKITASMLDGVGASHLTMESKIDGERLMSVALLKEGHGIKDAFVLNSEQQSAMKHVIEVMKGPSGGDRVHQNVARIFLEGAVADGLKAGNLPAAGFLDFLEATGLYDLRPQTLGEDALMDLIDTDGRIRRASDQELHRWLWDARARDQLGALAASWFVDTGETRTILGRARSQAAKVQKLKAYLDKRRTTWARRFLMSALTLSDKGQRNCRRLLAASASALLAGREVDGMILMHDLIDKTIMAHEYG